MVSFDLQGITALISRCTIRMQFTHMDQVVVTESP